MAKRSIGSKIQGLEDRLRAENEMRNREDPSFNNVRGGMAPPRPGESRHPRLGAITTRSKPKIPLPLHAVSYPIRSSDIETENKLKEIYTMSGKLNIQGVLYQSEIVDLEHLGELGSGTCGHVVKMLHKPSGAVIAVKQMRRSGNSEENKRILMDLDVVLRSHGCPYIVKCLGCFITDTDVWICMELMASCFDKLLKRLCKPIPEDILGKVTVATVNALSYLKDAHGVIHRDVKPSNILIDERGNVKLCDFGISGRLVDSKAKTRSAGCAAYMAPERIDPPDPLKPDYDIRADVWSLGISLVELATGIFPYRDCQNDFEVLTKVIGEDPPSLPESQQFSPEFKSFVQQCLTKNYRHRPKYTKLLEHPFVKKSLCALSRVDEWYLSVAAAPPSPLALPLPRLANTTNRILTNQNSTDKPNKTKSMPVEITAEPTKDSATNGGLIKENGLFDSLSPNNVCSDEDNTSIPAEPSDRLMDDTDGLRSSAKENDYRFVTSSEEYESGSYGSMNIDNDATDLGDVNMSSAENLSSMKSIDSNVNMPTRSEGSEQRSTLNAGRNISTDNTEPQNGRMIIWNNVMQPRHSHGSPKEYYLPHRFRSHSNSMQAPHVAEHNGHRFASGSPNSKLYHNNTDARGNVHYNGTRFKSGTDVGDLQDNRRFGSPEVARRQLFAHTNPFRSSQEGTPEPPAFIPLHAYDNEVSPSAERPPVPQFRPQGPTSYFAATTTASNLRFGPPAGSYHYNPGGSCSQPASLEGYVDSRINFSPYSRRRTLDQCMSPPPRAGYSDRRRPIPNTPASSLPSSNVMDQTRMPLRHGNTSPIVLQRFYHQQSQQRRSRADLNESTARQRSLSRDHSSGRSPEPPPRTSRDSGGSRILLVEGQTDLLHQRLESDSRSPRFNPTPSLEREKYVGEYEHEQDNGYVHGTPLNHGDRCNAALSPPLGRLENERTASLTRCFDGRASRDREKWDVNGDCGEYERVRTNGSHKKTHSKDKDEQGWLNSIAGIVKRRFTSYVKMHLSSNNSSGANRSSSPGGLIPSSHLFRGHRQRKDDPSDFEDIKLKLQYQRDVGPSILTRYGCATPQPSRVRTPLSLVSGVSEGASWSVPASPRPSPRPAPLRNLLQHRPD